MDEPFGNGFWQLVDNIESGPYANLLKVEEVESGKTFLARELILNHPLSNSTENLDYSTLISKLDNNSYHLARLYEIIPSAHPLLIYDCSCQHSLQSELEYRTLGWQEGFETAKQVCLGLIDLHSKDLVHGRLHPENCLVLAGSNIKLSEYGLSFLWGEVSEQALPYLDPLIETPTNRTALSDIYAFGVLLYQLATGSLPFEIKSLESRRKRPKTIPPAIGKRASEWPQKTFELVSRCTSLNPEERFEDINQVYNYLAVASPSPLDFSRTQRTDRNESQALSADVTRGINFSSANKPPAKSFNFQSLATPVVLICCALVTFFLIRDSDVASKLFSDRNESNQTEDYTLKDQTQPQEDLIDIDKIAEDVFVGALSNFPKAGRSSKLELEKRAKNLLVTLPDCGGIKVDSETGYFYCGGDAFLEIDDYSSGQLAGRITYKGRKLKFNAINNY